VRELILLGESLTSLLYAAGSSKYGKLEIVDIWEGGSLLYGWKLTAPTQLKCIDRVPILCNERTQIEEIGGKPIAIELNVSFIGSEEEYKNKITLDSEVEIQRDWILEYSNSKYYVMGGWCNIFNRLRSRIKVPRIYGELQTVLPRDQTLIVRGLRIRYDAVLNTLPLPYILDKIADKELSDFLEPLRYVSFYITSLIIKRQLNHLRVTYVGKRGYLLAAVVELPVSYLVNDLGNYIIVYCFVPISLGKLRAELFQKVLTELRKLRIIESYSDIIAERSYFERYGLLGVISSYSINYIIKELKKHDIYLGGRLGLWQEKSISEIISSASKLL